MALSGQAPNGYFGNSHYLIQTDWSATQSISGNYSMVTAECWFWSDPSWSISTGSHSGSITIDGTTYSFSVPVNSSGGQWIKLASYTKQVNHNANGTKSFNYSSSYTLPITIGSYLGTATSSGSATLDTIPRKSSLTSSPSWTAGNDFTLSLSVASSSFTHLAYIDVLDQDGSTWHNVNSVSFSAGQTSKSSGFTTTNENNIFTWLNGRSSMQCRINLHTYDSNGNDLGYNTYTGTVTAPVASTTVTPDSFTNGGSFTASITRANSNFLHTVKLKNGSTVYKTLTNQGTSAVFDTTALSDDGTNTIAKRIYDATVNAASISLTIETTTYYNGILVRSATTETITANIDPTTNAPTFTTANYSDYNATTSALTSPYQGGNTPYIIQNQSKLRATVPDANKAVGKNSATIVKYIATVAGESITVTSWTAGQPINFDFDTINATADQNLVITAYDSRGFTTSVTLVVHVVPWSPPVVNTSAARTNGFLAETTLTLAGSISPLNVNGTNVNSLVAASTTYQYRIKGGSYNAPIQFNGQVLTMPNYTASNTLVNSPTGLDTTQTWEILVTVTDKLGSTQVTLTVGTGVPILFIDDALKSIGVGKFPTGTNTLEAAGDVIGAGKGTFTSDVSGAKGIFSGDVSGVKGTFTSDVSGVKGIFSGDVSGVNGSFSGNVSGVNGNFTGSITLGSPATLLVPWTNFYSSMTNGWVVYGGGYSYPSYCKDSNGNVRLRGTMKSGSNGVIYTLPAGLRPANSLAFPIIGYNGSSYAIGYLTIGSTGQLNVQLTSGFNQWVPLDGITWYAEV
jgi:hypothetical protein